MQSLELSQRLLTFDTDAFGLWRPDAIFRLMQEVSGMHSAALGFSRDNLLEKNCVWMLARVQLIAEAYPRYLDTVRAHTWYGPAGRITCPRYTEFTGENGEHLADIAASWIMVDTASRRILLPEKAGFAFPPALERTPPLGEPVKIRLNTQCAPKITLRAPQYCDLDLNGHMNNASYISWILDLFPMSWHESHRIRSLYISYSAEAKPHEPVQMALHQYGLSFDLNGTDAADGHVVFEARGEWMPVSAFV